MFGSVSPQRAALIASLALAAGALVALGISGSAIVAPAPAAPQLASVPASGATQQWAFGGSAGADYSCSGSACGSGSSLSSLSLRYYVEWVVIYTATNVSSTQTEFEAQSAINATVSLSVVGCVNETGSGCSTFSASGNLAGSEIATGFTNVTNSGSVDLSSGPGAPGPVAALAILDAQSSASFNFSGAFSESITVNGTPETANFNFDLGGSASSGITFSTPLGVVPTDAQPGQQWNSSAPFSATGSYTSGYSLSVNIDGHSEAENDWKSLAVTPSGTLSLQGEDLGAVTLYDNYTSPPTSATAQVIALSFGSGDFLGADGWLLLPSGLYDGALGAFSGISLIAGQPSTSTSVASGETADYQSGVGFVGSSEQTNASTFGLSGGPSLGFHAGPEPVSVASQQYSAITSGAAGSSGVPWTDLIVVAVVVILVVVVVVLLVRARSRRPPAATTAPPPVESAGVATSGPSGPAGPGNAMPAGASAAAGLSVPRCPTCGQSATYVAEYGRYYCPTDRTYL